VQKVGTALLALLTLLVVAGAGYVITHKDPVPDAGLVPSTASSSASSVTPSSAAASSDGRSSGAPSGAASSTTQRPLVVAFLGDDWTSGAGASSHAKRWTSLTAKSLHLDEHNFGSAGTGYATSGAGGSYRTRLGRLVAAHPDVVVVSGGRNDIVQSNGQQAATAAGTLFIDLHAALPSATLIALAPMWGDSAAPSKLATLAQAVRHAVQSASGRYLDLADPINGHASYMADASDPDDRGYAAIAAAVEPALRPLLPA
jgi:lysophospholipase L1-like esterase